MLPGPFFEPYYEEASLALLIAGDFGFLTLIQSRDGPGRYRLSRRFETSPSSIMSQAARNKSRADLALLEGRKVDAVSTTRQQAGEVSLAQVQRQLTQIVAIKGKDVEGIELDLVVVLSCTARQSRRCRQRQGARPRHLGQTASSVSGVQPPR
jgi:hypothetical protein